MLSKEMFGMAEEAPWRALIRAFGREEAREVAEEIAWVLQRRRAFRRGFPGGDGAHGEDGVDRVDEVGDVQENNQCSRACPCVRRDPQVSYVATSIHLRRLLL